MASELVVLKLGGSIVTDKQRELTAARETIARAMNEIKSHAKGSVIIVHGGGSYGHPLARSYRISEGHVDSSQITGFVKTRQAMTNLNKLILDIALEKGLACVSVQPSAFIRTKNKRIHEMDVKIVKGILDLGMIPLLYGDVVLDEELGFCVLSGDQLTARLAMELHASRIILAADVDGIFDSDPKSNPKARLIQRMTAQEVRGLVERIGQTSQTQDVTGEMAGKMKEVLTAVEGGMQVMILNGLVPGRIAKALKGESVVATVLER